MQTNPKQLSDTLVVRNTLCFGSPGLLGSEGRNHQRDDVGQHVIDNAGDVQRSHEVEAGVHIAQCPAEAEQQCRQRDLQRMPCTDYNIRENR